MKSFRRAFSCKLILTVAATYCILAPVLRLHSGKFPLLCVIVCTHNDAQQRELYCPRNPIQVILFFLLLRKREEK